MKPIRVFSAVLAILVVSLAVACSGGKKDSQPATTGSTSGPSQNASTNGSSGSTGGGQTLDLSKASSAMQQLQSYRFDLSMNMDFGTAASGDAGDTLGSALLGALGNIKAKGAFVNPDQVDMTMSLLGQDMAYIQIGQQAWVKAGGQWEATSPDNSGLGSPSDLFKDFVPSDVIKYSKTSRESVNGQKATHYSFDKNALQQLAQELGTDTGTGSITDLSKANLDMWVTDENIPVKMLMDMAGTDSSGQKMSLHMEMNITDINSKITIKPPI